MLYTVYKVGVGCGEGRGVCKDKGKDARGYVYVCASTI